MKKCLWGSVLKLEFKNDILDINYIDEGSGDIIVLLHGWGTGAAVYKTIISHLAKTHRVIAPDMPGFGNSTEPSFPYTVRDFAEAVYAFLQKLGVDKAILLGHSHGGRVAIELMTGGFDIEVSKAVLVDSAGLIRKKSTKQKLKIFTFKTLKKIVNVSFIKQKFPQFSESLYKVFGSADYAAASPVMRRSLVKVINEDMTEKIKNISASTLLIWGDKDTDTPLSHGQKMEKLIRDSGLVVIPGGGHFCFLADMGLFLRVLDSFLS